MGEKDPDQEKSDTIAELERKLADREREIRQLLRRIERLERKNDALSRRFTPVAVVVVLLGCARMARSQAIRSAANFGITEEVKVVSFGT